MNVRKIKAAVYDNDYACSALIRACTWRSAASTVVSCNPTATMSIRVMRRVMRDNALDAISRAKYALSMKGAA